MEERLFLRWIARERGDVVCGHAQMPAFVEANFANPAFPLIDQAAMTAGVTLQRARVEMFGQLGRTFRSHRIEDGGERC